MGTRLWEAEQGGNLATVWFFAGRYEKAEAGYREAIECSRQVGHRIGERAFSGLLGALEAKRDRLDSAEVALEQARSNQTEPDERVFLDLCAAHLALARARMAGKEDRAVAHSPLLAARSAGPADGVFPDGRPAPSTRSHLVRVAMRLLESQLSRGQALRGAQPVSVASGMALEVGPGARWFRPGGGTRVDLARRRVLRRLLVALVEHRLVSPGAALSRSDLLTVGWPGEQLPVTAGRNRLNVALATLRKLGLDDSLVTRKDGYLLDPGRPVLKVEW
jgi:hypothetical protein